MPKIPGVNHLHAIRALEKAGFRVVRQGKHIVMSDGVRFLTIPRANPVNALIDDVLDYLCAAGERQQIYFLWRPILPDPHDDLVLEVAAHARCDRIVTFNRRDFGGSERFGIRAQTPAAFLWSLGCDHERIEPSSSEFPSRAGEGVSINQLVASALAEKMSALLTAEYLEARAQRGFAGKVPGRISQSARD